MLDAFCDDEFSGEEEVELDEESLLGSRGENSSSITLSDVSDVRVPDKSECEVVTQLPTDPDIRTIRASAPAKPKGRKEQSEAPSLKITPVINMPGLPIPCKLPNLPPRLRRRRVRL